MKSASMAWRTAHSPIWSKRPPPTSLEAAFERINDSRSPRTKRLLIVEDNDIERSRSSSCSGMTISRFVAVGSGGEALAALREAQV